jgi:hypothetical protein
MSDEMKTNGDPQVSTTPKESVLSRLWRVFYEPGRVFAEIPGKRGWIWPFLALSVISIVVAFVAIPRIDREATLRYTLDKFGGGREISDEQIERMSQSSPAMSAVKAVAGPPIAFLVVVAIGSLLYWLGLKLFGSEVCFGPVFAVAMYTTYAPQLVRKVLQLVFLLPRSGLLEFEVEQVVKSNLGAILNLDLLSAKGIIAASVDVFTIWQIVLLAIGLALVGKVSRGRAAGIAIAVTVLFVLFGAAMVSLPGMLMGGR